MKNLTYRVLIQSLFIVVMLSAVNAQTTTVEKKTDTIARLAVRYMNANKPDSVYQLTGDLFRNQISHATWNTVYTNQISGLLPFGKVEFVGSTGPLNTFKVTGKITLTYNVSLDSKNKLMDFSFVPYKE